MLFLLSHVQFRKGMEDRAKISGTSKKESEEAIAEHIGVTDRQIRNWMNYDTNVSISAYCNIIRVFGASMGDFLVARDEESESGKQTIEPSIIL